MRCRFSTWSKYTSLGCIVRVGLLIRSVLFCVQTVRIRYTTPRMIRAMLILLIDNPFCAFRAFSFNNSKKLNKNNNIYFLTIDSGFLFRRKRKFSALCAFIYTKTISCLSCNCLSVQKCPYKSQRARFTSLLKF